MTPSTREPHGKGNPLCVVQAAFTQDETDKTRYRYRQVALCLLVAFVSVGPHISHAAPRPAIEHPNSVSNEHPSDWHDFQEDAAVQSPATSNARNATFSSFNPANMGMTRQPTQQPPTTEDVCPGPGPNDTYRCCEQNISIPDEESGEAMMYFHFRLTEVEKPSVGCMSFHGFFDSQDGVAWERSNAGVEICGGQLRMPTHAIAAAIWRVRGQCKRLASNGTEWLVGGTAWVVRSGGTGAWVRVGRRTEDAWPDAASSLNRDQLDGWQTVD